MQTVNSNQLLSKEGLGHGHKTTDYFLSAYFMPGIFFGGVKINQKST